MKKLFCVMGKSATGKDTIYREILRRMPDLGTVIPYTTRPMRDGETDGKEYFFIRAAEMEQLDAEGKIIESRVYQTVCGPWIYATVDDGQFDRIEGGCLVIGTLVSFEKLRQYFGKHMVIPVYVETEAGLRLSRALDRERQQSHPQYEEMCRRFLADEKDFCEENLKKCGIGRRYVNADLETCIREIMEDIRGNL